MNSYLQRIYNEAYAAAYTDLAVKKAAYEYIEDAAVGGGIGTAAGSIANGISRQFLYDRHAAPSSTLLQLLLEAGGGALGSAAGSAFGGDSQDKTALTSGVGGFLGSVLAGQIAMANQTRSGAPTLKMLSRVADKIENKEPLTADEKTLTALIRQMRGNYDNVATVSGPNGMDYGFAHTSK